MEKYPKYLLIVLIGAVLLSLPANIPLIKSYSEYSIFNTDWNGCSKFTGQIYDSKISITPIYSQYDEYNFDKNGVLFIIGPEVDFSDFEIEKLENFVKNGNTLVIADDFGKSNQILEKLNLTNKFTKNKLNDIFYISNENLVEYKVPESYGGGNIVTNIPAYTYKAGLVTTSNFSKSYSKSGPLTLISEMNYGNGKIILIADPDIFTNGLYEYNQNFLENFITNLNSNHTYIDEIHHKDFGYEINVFYVQKSVPKEFTLFLMLILISLFQINNQKLFNTATKNLNSTAKKLISKFVKNRKETEEDEILKNISKNHDIDLNDLKRVIRNLKDGNNGRKRITK